MLTPSRARKVKVSTYLAVEGHGLSRSSQCDSNAPCDQCAKNRLECTFEADLKLLASTTSTER